ncbi:MAG: GNAT family N-acetyltransferase [Pseudomonadota bacterium]
MSQAEQPIVVAVGELTKFRGSDLPDLCEAAEEAIRDGGGFGWITPPDREVMERYWRGVLAMPGRTLFVARLDNVVVGSTQLVRPPINNEAQAMVASLASAFVAPWARGHGLARGLVETAEARARKDGFAAIQLDVRESQKAAIELYRGLDYRHWGTNPVYAQVDGKAIAGLYFCKDLSDRSDNETT